MKRIVWAAMLAGFLTALVLGTTWLYIHNHNVPRTEAALVLWKITFWIWPTARTMGPDAEGSFGITLLLMSSILNGLVFAMVAFCVAFAWKALSAHGRTQSSD